MKKFEMKNELSAREVEMIHQFAKRNEFVQFNNFKDEFVQKFKNRVQKPINQAIVDKIVMI